MDHQDAGSERIPGDPHREHLLRAVEARARAEALAQDELTRMDSLRSEVGELEARAGPVRRALAAFAGGRLWELLAPHGSSVGTGDSEAKRQGAELRRRRFRLTRRKRVLEHGGAELRRAAGKLGRRVRGERARLARRPPREPRTLILRRRGGSRQAVTVSVVLIGPPLAAARAAARAMRADPRPSELLIVPGRARQALGPAVAAASKRASGDIVAVAFGAPDALAERLERLVEPLLADPQLSATAESAARFEWSDATPSPVAAHPKPRHGENGNEAKEPAAALTGPLAAIRRELLQQHPPCASYRGPLWLTDLSLEAAENGHRMATIPREDGAAPLGPRENGVATDDLALLRRRWGPALRQRILADLLAGGGRWCARPARVLVGPECPPAVAGAVAALGLERAACIADADVAIGADPAGQVTLDWILAGERSVASAAALAEPLNDAGGHGALAEALAAAARAPCFCLRVASRDWEAAGYGGDAALARSLARALGERGHQALLQVDADVDRPAGECLDVLLVLRGRWGGEPTPGRVNLIWQISHPEETETAELDRYDRVLVASKRYAQRLARSVRPPVEPLLQFTDPSLFHPVKGLAPKHDLAFVGNWRGEFRRIVWDTLEAGYAPALYGRGWDLLAPEHTVAEHVPHDELCRLYSSCEILLCDHWDDMRRHGFVSNRVFDALACETFVLADDNAALAEELPGAVETYSSPAELGDKLERHIADPGGRERRAHHGRAMVLANHTVEQRAEQLLAIAAATARECERPMTRHLREPPRGWHGAPATGASAAAGPRREAGAGLA